MRRLRNVLLNSAICVLVFVTASAAADVSTSTDAGIAKTDTNTDTNINANLDGNLDGNADAHLSYQVAAGAVSITPAPGAYLAGYGNNRLSTGHYDNLWLKTLVVSDAHELLVLLTVDSIGLTRPDILRIQLGVQQQYAQAKVVVSSTHTHAAPDVVGIWGPQFWRSGRDEAYMQLLVDQAVSLIGQTIQRRVPADSRVASVDLPLNWVRNLSEPELLDPRLSVLQFVNKRGVPLATLVNYACHPTVLGPENTMVSADYLAGFYQTMAAAVPGEHLFLQGAVGGWVQPLQGDRSQQLAVSLGAQLADRTLALVGEAEPNPYQPLTYVDAEFDVALENWGFRLLMWLGVLQRPVAGSALSPTLRTGVAYFRIGEVEFATHPGETSPAYSLATRQLLNSEHNFVLGLSQDAIGYILKPDYFANPHSYPHADYLTTVSVGADTGPAMMATLTSLITDQTTTEAK